MLFAHPPVAVAQAESAPEHSIKAAYLYNFATYVDWPPSALGEQDAPVVIGVLGDAQVASELASMTGSHEVHGRPIEVRQLRSGDPIAGLHMLFVARESAPALTELREEARENAVLVVTEWGDALQDGSVINFLLIDQQVRFEISLDAADSSGLVVSSRMLAVAERVERRSGE